MKPFNKGDVLRHDMGRLFIYERRRVGFEEECVVRTKDGEIRYRHERYLTKLEGVTNRDMVEVLEKE